MILYRYEYKNSGIMSGEAIDILLDKKLHELGYFDKYRNLMYKLHCPMDEEFLSENNPPKTALFYFTEEGKETHKLLIEEFYVIYGNAKMKVDKIIIDTDDLMSYKVYYQDKDQMCLEIIKSN